MSLLLRGLGHELGNLLAPALLAVDLLERRIEDPATAELLEPLREASREALQRVREVGELGRDISQPHMAVRIRYLLEGLRKQLDASEIPLDAEIAPDLSQVHGDPGALLGLLSELLEYAVSQAGDAVQLELQAENEPPEVPGETGLPTENVRIDIRWRAPGGESPGVGLPSSLDRAGETCGGSLERVHGEAGETGLRLRLPIRIQPG